MRRLIVLAAALLMLAGCADGASGDYDVDLTHMSATMVYSEVFDMLNTPENYMGKSVCMDGLFTSYLDPENGRYYYACIVQDATACCAQGIEFVLAEPRAPEDYPGEGDFITVSGTFDTYEENGFSYVQLVDAVMR